MTQQQQIPDAAGSHALIITSDNLDEVKGAASFVIPIFKEAGYSSGFFVNGIRRRLSTLRGVKRFKVGHAGTLDPFAEGVLLALCGHATREQSLWMKRPKEYEATVRLGETTPSLDPDTPVSSRDAAFKLDAGALSPVLARFTGELEQVPPLYSAKKVDGVRAYKIARKADKNISAGQEAPVTPAIVLKPARVRIDAIELLGVESNDIRIRVTCGSGVYIRALARDIAAALGTCGYLTGLTRTRSGGVDVLQCLRLRQVLNVQ